MFETPGTIQRLINHRRVHPELRDFARGWLVVLGVETAAAGSMRWCSIRRNPRGNREKWFLP